MFGKNSVNPVYSGSGSSGGTPDNTVGILDSLKSAGFRVNPVLEGFYSDEEASGPARPSMGFSSYNYHSYFPTAGDAPGQVHRRGESLLRRLWRRGGHRDLRTGGEGLDLPGPPMSPRRTRARSRERKRPGVSHLRRGGGRRLYILRRRGPDQRPHEHYLELDDNEVALINEVTARFDKVVLIVNSSNAMELDREIVVNNDKIQSVIFAPRRRPERL